MRPRAASPFPGSLGRWRRALPVTLLLVTASLAVGARDAEPAARFMVLIDEKNLGGYAMGDAERVVTEHLRAASLEVVDAELVKTTVNRDQALQAMSSGPQAAAALGLQFGADMIVVGTAVAKGSAERVRDTSFRSYTANVSLKAIRTDTAEIVVTGAEMASRIHVDDTVGGSLAIRVATAQLASKLVPAVVASLGTGANSAAAPRRIHLVVGEMRQLWQVAALKQLIREQIKGVRDVVQRSYVSGVGMFEVHYTGDSQRLAEELTLADPGYFRLQVLSVTPNKLDTRLVEK